MFSFCCPGQRTFLFFTLQYSARNFRPVFPMSVLRFDTSHPHKHCLRPSTLPNGHSTPPGGRCVQPHHIFVREVQKNNKKRTAKSVDDRLYMAHPQRLQNKGCSAKGHCSESTPTWDNTGIFKDLLDLFYSLVQISSKRRKNKVSP